MRLEWWREQVHAAVEHGPKGDAPAVRAIAETVARHKLDLGPLYALIDARCADLYSDPPATVPDLLKYLGETEAVLFKFAAGIFGCAASDVTEAAYRSGMAYGVAVRLANLAHDRAAGRSILPKDLLAGEGLTTSALLTADEPEKLRKVVSALTMIAREHLLAARAETAKLPRPARLAFLPLAIVEPLTARIDQLGGGIFSRRAELSDLAMLSRIAWARLRGSP
jgi:phytoene synthase